MPGDSAQSLVLQPRDPIIVRDARPFSADPGARAVTLDWPLPTTVSGALRTHIGNELGFDWSQDGPDRARQIAVQGPLLLARGVDGTAEVYLPAPRDAVPYEAEDGGLTVLCLRPTDIPAGAGCDLPGPAGLKPVKVDEDAKPTEGIAFWSLGDTVRWLSQPRDTRPPDRWLGPLPRDVRTHVGIDPRTQTHLEGALFTTAALAFNDVPHSLPRRPPRASPALSMLCRVQVPSDNWAPAEAYLALGGERRVVTLRDHEQLGANWPVPPDTLVNALIGAPRVRLQLVAPGIFSDCNQGWIPGWLDDQLRGAPPGLTGVGLQLVGAVIGRRVPVSGWDLRRPGPRPTRFAAPAGSVYFFDVTRGEMGRQQIEQLWLQSIADGEQDRRDGFGLVVPGVW